MSQRMQEELWLQEWYFARCNGDWEHSEGVSIETLDNPGWKLAISLADTDLEGLSVERVLIERSEHDWVAYETKDGKFVGACGPLCLNELVAVFKRYWDASTPDAPVASELLDRVKASALALSIDLKLSLDRSYEELAGSGVTTLDNLEALLRDSRADSSLVSAACYVAGLIGELRLAEPIAAVFRRSADAGVIWEAAKALAAFKQSQSLQALMPCLNTGEDPTRQAAAAWTVGVARYNPAVPALVTLLTNRELSEVTRGHAAEALGVVEASEATDVLITALSDASPEVRYWSVYALAMLKATHARDAIEQLARTDDGVTARGFRVADEARWALTQIPDASR